MEDLLTGGDEIIGNDPAMASPPDGLCAHDARTGGVTEFAQISEARTERLAHRVIGVIVEACVVPEGVDLGRHARLLSAKSPERGHMLVRDAMRRERGGENVAVELRIGPRTRNGPHVDDELDFGGLEQRDKLFRWASRMSDGEEWIGHEEQYTSPAP